MKKIVVTLIAAALLSATTAAPVFAHGYYGRGVVVDPLWPVAAALALPGAILGTVANAITPAPVYVSPYAPVYSAPATYYAPRSYYYTPRVYVAPRAYYPPRYYYAPRYYRSYGW